MGIKTDRFVSAIPPDAYCVLCSKVLEDPIEIIECGHLICLKCWEDSGSKNLPCPFCGNVISINGVRKSMITWNLIKNMMVFCARKDSGCESIFKYSDEELHLQECSYELTKQMGNANVETLSNCTTCGIVYKDNHDCINALVDRLKQQSIRISNLEMENKKIAYHLAIRERIHPDSERCKFLPTTLNVNKDTDSLTSLPSVQTETPRCEIDGNFEKIHISLERKDGSLGFNIIGGTSLKDAKQLCGIYVSRVAEGGAAAQLGKLELNDRIIEVDGLDLRAATHAFAVQTFRNSGNPVEMIIERKIKRKTCEAGTQTHGIEPTLSDEVQDTTNTKKKPNWTTIHDFKEKELINLASCEEALEVIKQLRSDIKDENKSELYDSAYDTLLTQRSTRSLRQLSCEGGLSKGRPLLQENDKVEGDDISRTISKLNEDKEKRLSTFFVIPGNATPVSEQDEKVSWEDGCSEAEMEYEYEYEEVTLQKDGGKYGLLLCYGGDATDVAVYVGDMEENSVADTSGKIMVGDQIVQINGCQINNVDQAYQILHDNEEIILIVARAVYEVQSSEFLEDQEETDLDCLDSIVEESVANFDEQTNPSKFAQSVSSDISCSSNSIASNKEPAYLSSSLQVQTNLVRSSGSTSTNSNCFEEFKEEISLDFNKDRPTFSIGSHKNEKESVKKSLKNFVRNALGHTDKGGTLSRESCDSSKSQRSDSNSSCSNTRKNSNNCNKSNDLDVLKIKIKEQKQLSKLKAYADSPSLNRQRQTNNNAHPPPPRMESLIYPTPSIQSLHSQPTPSLKSAMKNGISDLEKVVKHVKIDSHSNWNETERRVWEEFKIIQSMEGKENKEQSDALKIEAEWRVRRSKDGKHIYIKKTNPSRSRVLKERERQLNLERCGVTTDDDAFTVYQGQYWNKGQRRKQLNRHNERRKRILQKSAQKALHENKTEKVFAEIVQRKMTLPGKVFDNFVTVEEILSQRNRSGILEGPVHVTTI